LRGGNNDTYCYVDGHGGRDLILMMERDHGDKSDGDNDDDDHIC
jgi:hypothetical protein